MHISLTFSVLIITCNVRGHSTSFVSLCIRIHATFISNNVPKYLFPISNFEVSPLMTFCSQFVMNIGFTETVHVLKLLLGKQRGKSKHVPLH